jgi:hypothetical protein
MKKISKVLLFIPVMMLVAMNANAQVKPVLNGPVKKIDKELGNECKNRVKTYKEGQWSLYDTSQTLEWALLNHFPKLEEGNCHETAGTATKVISIRTGILQAKNNASSDYAQRAMTQMVDFVMNNIGELNEEDGAAFKSFFSIYQSKMEEEINKELTPSYSVYHSNGKDESGAETFDVQSYFFLDDSTATQARIKAVNEALSENKTAQKYSDRIRDFVKEEK